MYVSPLVPFMKWIFREYNEDKVERFSKELGVHSAIARVLIARGIKSLKDANVFLSPNLADISNPFEIPDMNKGVSRIESAIKNGESIAIFGDYDVDGVSSVALLSIFFDELGVGYKQYLPNRMMGYGLNKDAVKKIYESGIRLIITVDNGTCSNEEIDYANSLGMDVIVTDHHSICDSGLPHAKAVINPKMLAKDHPLYNLCGCGVVFMLTMAMRKKLRDSKFFKADEPNLKQHLDLVALATVADVVSLLGINRILVSHGMRELKNTSKVGIGALMSVSSVKSDDIDANSIGFRLAPRINAAGRLGDAESALKLLICRNDAEAKSLAEHLDIANRERKNIEQKMLRDMREKLNDYDLSNGAGAVIMGSKGWHIGVIGIAASKISDETNLPTIIISNDTIPSRGSARSARGINLMDALSRCGENLVSYGGHPAAAGIAVKEENIDAFRIKFEEICADMMPDYRDRILKIDSSINLGDIGNDFVEKISSFAPFGEGNPTPLFSSQGKIMDKRIVGKNHLKLILSENGLRFDAIAFGMGDAPVEVGDFASIAFTPEFNVWNGNKKIQLKIKDLNSVD